MKYMGSKAKIARYIVPVIQECIDNNNISEYTELFCGGCNIIDKINCNHKQAVDNNKYSIALLENLHMLDFLPDTISKEDYGNIRQDYTYGISSNKYINKYADWYIGAVGFLASYNGKFFDGGYGGIAKTQDGKIRNYYQESLRNLLKQRDNLSDVFFKCSDYAGIDLGNYGFIYCDIPYKNTEQYNTSKDFDYEKFYNYIRKYSKTNYILISEEEMPEDFVCIWEQEMPRTINNRARKSAIEKLFTSRNGLFYQYWVNK